MSDKVMYDYIIVGGGSHVRRLARPDVMPRIPRGLHAGYAGW